MNKLSRYFFFFLLLTSFVYSVEYLEEKPIARIDIFLKTEDPSLEIDKKTILSKLRTKIGDPFSQIIFDADLKTLSEDYDSIQHEERAKDNSVYITVYLWPRPVIQSINWHGNVKVKTSKLQSELDVEPGIIFNRQQFNEKFNALKEFYVKKGFFESQLSYRISQVPKTNQIIIDIDVKEGKSGNIQKIVYKGLTSKEISDISSMIYTKKYNFLYSWMTGAGNYNEEVIQQDKMVMLNYLHNEGYADAKLTIEMEDDPFSGQIIVVITAQKGKIYRFGTIEFDGNVLLSNEEIKKVIFIHPKDHYSPEQLHNTIQAIKDLYGKEGYIEADIQYETNLSEKDPIFNIKFHIHEGEKFRIGMVRIFGNETTKTNVILRESLLVPGEVFDSRRLKATQMRLEGIGYFKNVNVYAVRTSDDLGLGPNFRDVYIEVEETSTGSINLSIGASSTDKVFGTLELSERNFYLAGLSQFFKKGPGAFRGGGEYFQLRGSLGTRQYNYSFTWADPYFRDSLWRVGFEGSVTSSRIQSDDYRITTYGFSLFASYPFSSYLTYGHRYRLRHTQIHIEGEVDDVVDPDQHNMDIATTLENEQQNVGLISAYEMWLGYDSTDQIYKPFRGIRSKLEVEVAGIWGDFYFLKTQFLNSLYVPVTRRSTLKFRGDVQFLYPFEKIGELTAKEKAGIDNQATLAEQNKIGKPFGGIPISERFFLGGVSSVRGYKPMIIGPTFPNRDVPAGGLSATLLSCEYLIRVVPIADVFAFFDAGQVSKDTFTIERLKTSWGWGVRLEVMNRMPIIIGMGYPINPDHESDVEQFFFSFGGQF